MDCRQVMLTFVGQKLIILILPQFKVPLSTTQSGWKILEYTVKVKTYLIDTSNLGVSKLRNQIPSYWYQRLKIGRRRGFIL